MKKLGLIAVVFWMLAIAGWCQSLYKLTQCDFEPSYKAEIIYGIGTVTGLGMVLGWFDFGK